MTAQAVKGLSTGRWNVIETRDGSEHTWQQLVWSMGGAGVSPASYVDELLLIDIDGGPDGDCDPDTDGGMESGDDRRYFVHQDRNWNVVALTEYGDDGVGVDGRVAERYAYTPYGEFVVFKGDAGAGELGRSLPTSPVGNVFAHQGLPFDAEKSSYQNRWRDYGAQLHRFTRRDPLSVDGVTLRGESRNGKLRSERSLYGYTGSNPLRLVDPSGLYSCDNQDAMWCVRAITVTWCNPMHTGTGSCLCPLGIYTLPPDPGFTFFGCVKCSNLYGQDCRPCEVDPWV